MPTRKTPARRRAGKEPGAARRRPSPRARRPAIAVPQGWTLDRGGRSISRQLTTRDFVEAVDIINEVRDLAEALQHHPDLHLERWNRLRIATWSHDVDRLTERDERLAEGINGLLAKRGAAAGRGPGRASTG